VANNRWITKPQRRQPKIDLKEIDNMVQVWHTLIDNAERLQDLDTAETLLKLARTYRKLGLKQPEGEFSTANLVYKVMRMDQSLERLQDLRDKLHDRWLSVT
jgi:Zn-finger domain-containing protein